MAYEQHTWHSQELITDEQLNNMEAGIAAATTTADNAVPKTLTINGKALSANITLNAADVGAVPTARTINGKALSADITLTTSDLGAVAKSGDTMTGALNVAAPISSYHSTTPSFAYKLGANDNPIAESAARAGTRVLFFREYASDTEYHEDYLLPQPESNLTESGNYSILTTKGSYTLGGSLTAPEINTLSADFPAYWYKNDNSSPIAGYHGIRMSDRRFVIAYRNAAGINQQFSLPPLSSDTSESTWYDILTTYNISATRTALDVYSKSEVDAMITGGATPSGDYLPISGGNITGNLSLNSTTASLRVGSTDGSAGVSLYYSSEGGNINVKSPNGTNWEMDAYSNTFFRLYYDAGSPSWLFNNEGSLQIQGTKAAYFKLKSNMADITSSTNNVTGDPLYPALIWLDKNNVTTCRFENILNTDGSNAFYIYIQNRDSSGTSSGLRGIKYTLTNANVGTWSISDAAAFRTALGLGSNATSSTAYLPLTGGTISSTLTVSGILTMGNDIVFNDVGTGTRQLKFVAGTNDYGRVAVGATATNAGWMEIATADDASEPIYVRQYSGNYVTIARTLTLLDASGNTSIPGSLTLGSALGLAYGGTGATTAAAARTNLGLGDMATKSSSDYWAVSASRTANTVLAAPNGSAGSASFRALVAADIPVLDASKITSGTLPIARGGTSSTTAAGARSSLGLGSFATANIHYSTSTPSSSLGVNGDVCFVPV